MIPSGRLVALLGLPVVLGLVWMAVPAALPVLLGFDVLLLLVAGLDAWRSGGQVRVSRAHGELQAVGRPFDVELQVENRGARPLDLWVSDDAPGEPEGLPLSLALDAGAAARFVYPTTVHRRGRHRFGAMAARWRSPWGLWWRQVRAHSAEEDAVRVYPDFSFLRQAGLKARLDERQLPVRTRRRPGGDSEFERLRHYVQGDPYRHIDWKATARRQRFITRQYTQEANQNVIFLLDTGRMMTMSMGELTAFDHALNAALALGHAALQHGDRVGLLAFDSEVRAWMPPRGGTRTASRLIHGTYDLFPRLEEPDHAGAFRHLAGAVSRRSLVVLLTAVQDQVNADAAAAVARALGSRHLPLCVWLRDPRLDALASQPADDEASFYGRGAAAELLAWRAEALAGLRRRGVLVVDTAPEDLSTALLSRYLEIKARRLL